MDPTIITSATTAFATTIATKSIEAPLETINDLWNGAIGHTIAAWSEKRRIQAFQNVEDFKQDLANELNKIPIENIQEPQISIVGPTLEASKYYMDEEELRLMFAKIISASMDSRKNGYVQHSFVEVIKQLTPLDAQIFKSFHDSEPIANIYMILNSDNLSAQTIYYDLFVHPSFPDNELNSISVNNLQRLGLINIDYTTSFTDNSRYDHFKNTQEYLKVQRRCRIDGDKTTDLTEGLIKVTNFGKAFKDICSS